MFFKKDQFRLDLPAFDLREQIERIKTHDQLVVIDAPVDPHLELAEIHRRVVAEQGPALLFTNVTLPSGERSRFPVVTNLYGSYKRALLSLGESLPSLLDQVVDLIHEGPSLQSALKLCLRERQLLGRFFALGRRRVSTRRAPICQGKIDPVDLYELPILTSWPEDGGAFVTLPLVLTQLPPNHPRAKSTQENLGMYRIQRFNEKETGLHFQIQKGGGFHYLQAQEENLPLHVAIFVGGSPALTLGAIAPLPENLSEILLASFLLARPIRSVKPRGSHMPLFAEAEFALVGKSPPHTLREEGPFGDHYGLYSLKHPFPLFQCEQLWHRKDAIWPATIVGKVPQEDFYIGNLLQELLSPLLPLAMPGVETLWSYGESGFHALAGAVVKERYEHEVFKTAFRIFGEGQLSLTKTLLLTDQKIHPRNFPLMLKTVLERIDFSTQLRLFTKLSLDTLDYTGPKLNHGSRALLVGMGEPRRKLAQTEPRRLPPHCASARPFTPRETGDHRLSTSGMGTLLVKLNSSLEGQFDRDLLRPYFEEISAFFDPERAGNLADGAFPLIIITDNFLAASCAQEFLFSIFMRFDPAQDIYFHRAPIVEHHLCYQGAMVIDARDKPSYPKEVACDPITQALVDRRWKEYFA